jgi:hypothetical protein
MEFSLSRHARAAEDYLQTRELLLLQRRSVKCSGEAYHEEQYRCQTTSEHDYIGSRSYVPSRSPRLVWKEGLRHRE